MADNLNGIVQRMIDAGESEDNISTVIQHFKTQAPFDINASRAQLAKANANYDANPPAMQSPPSQWTRSAMGDRAIQGMKGEAEGFAGGLAGLVALPVAAGMAMRHPIDSAKALGTGALVAGGLAKQAYDKPSDTLSTLTNAAARFGSDPENIGRVAGGVDAAIAAPAISKAAANTRVGQTVGAGMSRFANRFPELKEMRAAWAASAPEAAPPAANYPSVDELRAAGVGKGSLDEIAKGWRPTSAAPPSSLPRLTTMTPVGSAAPALASAPEAAEAAVNSADVPLSVPAGTPRVLSVNPKYPWSPEQASQIRMGLKDWHTGESGNIAAKVAQGAHIEDGMLAQRFKQLMSDPKASLLPPAVALLLRKALLGQMADEQ